MIAWLIGRVASGAIRLGFTLARLAVKDLPRVCLFTLSDRAAQLGFVLFKGFRARSMRNLSVAFQDRMDTSAVADTAQRSLRNFFRNCVEIAITLYTTDDELRAAVPMVGREHLDAALNKGTGVLILSAHLGNFFLLGTRLAVDGYPVHVLINQPRDGQFAELMDRYRLKVKQRTIHARPRPAALKRLHEVLRANEIAVIIADEYRRGNGIPVSLFGRTVSARRGPATLALRTDAAVVPASVIRQPDDSLKLVIEPELQLDRASKSKAEVQENTIRMTQWLERMVLRYPDQWNWMNIHWSEAPAADLLPSGQPIRHAS
jgi:Kdo2-lipid IVA lauroyltransferase/acyltransferase